MIISLSHTDGTNINVLTIPKFGNSRQDYRMLPKCANHANQKQMITSRDCTISFQLSKQTLDSYETASDLGYSSLVLGYLLLHK